MKQITFLFTLTLVAISIATHAQKIKLTQGRLTALKTEKAIALQFTYDNMGVGKFDKEADYIAKRKQELNTAEAGKGDKWAESWLSDRKDAYEPKFIKLFTENTKMNIEPNAPYKLIFNTTFIEPGYNVGVWRGNAYINATATVVETAHPGNVIAIISLEDVKGKMPMGTDFATSWRIAESYARAGKEIARMIK